MKNLTKQEKQYVLDAASNFKAKNFCPNEEAFNMAETLLEEAQKRGLFEEEELTNLSINNGCTSDPDLIAKRDPNITPKTVVKCKHEGQITPTDKGLECAECGYVIYN